MTLAPKEEELLLPWTLTHWKKRNPSKMSILQIDALVTCLQMVFLQGFFGSSSVGNPSPRVIMLQE